MTVKFVDKAMSAFATLCKDFGLSIRSSCEDEVMLRGNSFALLVWLDRDGLSMKYVDTSSAELTAIDVTSYLATKRTWIVDTSVPLREDLDSQVQRGLLSMAHTLREIAPDILEGKKEWIKDCGVSSIKLSRPQVDAIRAILT
jgi:hypothetical protein